MTAKQKLIFAQRIEKGELQREGSIVRLPLSTILTEGEHNGILFLREEIEKAKFPEAFPLTLNHSRDVEDEVGWWESPRVEDGKLRAIPVINLETAKGEAALGYVKNRLQAGLVPEVSVEVWITIDQDNDGRKIARELEIDKASLVDRGACGPGKGCGIGLEKEEKGGIELGVVPKHPWRYGKDAEASWSKPSLGDFTSKSWGELSDSEKRSIAGHYAWAPQNPPERFTDLKLPHHRPKDHAVIWNGVRAAMAALLGARGGVDIPSGDKRAVYNHLAAHEIIEVLWMEEEDKKEFEQKEEIRDEAKEAKEMQNEAKEKVEKETPCSEEIEALIKAKDEEIAKLKAELKEMIKRYKEEQTWKEALNNQYEELEKRYNEALEIIKMYEEKEKQTLLKEIRKYNPDFNGEDKDIAELQELLEFIRGIKVLSGRKSLVISPEEEKKPEEMYEEILRKKVKELMRRD